MNVYFYCCSGVPGPPIARLLMNFFLFFFSTQPTNPISGNAFDAKLKKRGEGDGVKKLELIEGVHGVKLKTSHKAIPRKILLFVQSHLRVLPYYRKLTRR